MMTNREVNIPTQWPVSPCCPSEPRSDGAPLSSNQTQVRSLTVHPPRPYTTSHDQKHTAPFPRTGYGQQHLPSFDYENLVPGRLNLGYDPTSHGQPSMLDVRNELDVMRSQMVIKDCLQREFAAIRVVFDRHHDALARAQLAMSVDVQNVMRSIQADARKACGDFHVQAKTLHGTTMRAIAINNTEVAARFEGTKGMVKELSDLVRLHFGTISEDLANLGKAVAALSPENPRFRQSLLECTQQVQAAAHLADFSKQAAPPTISDQRPANNAQRLSGHHSSDLNPEKYPEQLQPNHAGVLHKLAKAACREELQGLLSTFPEQQSVVNDRINSMEHVLSDQEKQLSGMTNILSSILQAAKLDSSRHPHFGDQIVFSFSALPTHHHMKEVETQTDTQPGPLVPLANAKAYMDCGVQTDVVSQLITLEECISCSTETDHPINPARHYSPSEGSYDGVDYRSDSAARNIEDHTLVTANLSSIKSELLSGFCHTDAMSKRLPDEAQWESSSFADPYVNQGRDLHERGRKRKKRCTAAPALPAFGDGVDSHQPSAELAAVDYSVATPSAKRRRRRSRARKRKWESLHNV